MVVGAVAALAAVVFRGLIALFHNLLFLGQWSVVYDANVHTPASPWGPLVILVPVLGAAGVAFLVGNFAPEAKGHGVPEVIDAIYYKRGVVRPVVAVIKSLASALSIGSGGSVGREGPIIQIGASFASTLGQVLRVPVWQRITLIAAGAGAGIAATFNTPIGGVLFAVEIMLHEVSARTLVPVTIATATAAYIGQLVFGSQPSFVIPALETPYFHLTQPVVLLLYPGLGVLAGLASVAYIRSLYAFEDFFDKPDRGELLHPPSARHVPGGGHHVCPAGDNGTLPCRGGRLCHGAGRSFGTGLLVLGGAVRPEVVDHFADARLGGFGRRVFSRAVPGRHARRSRMVWRPGNCSRRCRSIRPRSRSPAWPAWSAGPRGRPWPPSS